MKFSEFFSETQSKADRHKHLSLERVYDFRLAVDDEFREKMMSYSGSTVESVSDYIQALVERYQEKWLLMRKMGLSNFQAERSLDRSGYPRPPGLHTIFFYPDSFMPRNRYIAILVIIAVIYIAIS